MRLAKIFTRRYRNSKNKETKNMKKWYLSKTVWVNFLTMVAAVVTAAYNSEFIAEYPQAVAALAAVVSSVNIALRFVTDSPIVSWLFEESDE